MVDQPYLTWKRGQDSFNVKGYGALADGSDDGPRIQAAVDAAQAYGGTVYFPPGSYTVNTRILVRPSSTAIRFLGCGGSDSPGSSLTMNKRDYILYCMHGNVGGGGAGNTVSVIEGLVFNQQYNGAAPTTTEPPNSPDIFTNVTSSQAGTSGNIRLSMAGAVIINNAFIPGQSVIVAGVTGTPLANATWTISATGTTSGTAWIEIPTPFVAGPSTVGTVTFNGDGCGCLYMSGMIGNVLKECEFKITTGIAVYYPGFRNCIENLTITGSYNWAGDPVNKTIGILTRSSNIRGGKWTALGTAICLIMGPSNVDFVDIEISGIGLRAGVNPVQHWESNNNDLLPAGLNCSVAGCSIRSFTMESMGDTAIWLQFFSGELVNVGISSFHQRGTPDYGLKIDKATGSVINVGASGDFNVAAIDATGIVDCTLTCTATNSGTGVSWILPTNLVANCHSGVQFVRCNVDGALAFSLFVTPASINGYEMMCSDSVDPVWTGTASNVGKPITGGGTNRVLARYAQKGRVAATASWTTASTSTIPMNANPGFVVPYMGVWNITANTAVGIVSSFTGTSLVLSAAPWNNSVGSTDVLAFGNWCIAG